MLFFYIRCQNSCIDFFLLKKVFCKQQISLFIHVLNQVNNQSSASSIFHRKKKEKIQKIKQNQIIAEENRMSQFFVHMLVVRLQLEFVFVL